jgi:large subunit ribosomal protein L23
MSQRTNPYQIIKRRHVTEKAQMLTELQHSDSNPCSRKCESPKYTFIVDPAATKQEIATAVMEIYKEWDIKVLAVNTINVKGKKRRVRGRTGFRSSFKKAVVTMEKGDRIEEI